MTESDQQRVFVKNIGKLIDWTYNQGYELTFGEAWRTPEQAAWNAAKGIGITKSLHIERLAIDLNLWKDGTYTAKALDYKPIGEYWKTLNPLNAWGGDFTTVDADHFSMSFGGRK